MKRLLLITAISLNISILAHAQGACNALDVNMGFANNALISSLNNTWHIVTNDMQKLMFEPDVWKAELAKVMNCSPSSFPSNWKDRVQENLENLRSYVESEGKTRSWTPRNFQRPVEQNMAKAKFLAFYKGATIVKIGSSYKDWNMFKNSLGIPTNRFIRGEAVLKIPGRPFCQAQEWIVRQKYAGGKWSAATVDSFGGGGYFVKCD